MQRIIIHVQEFLWAQAVIGLAQVFNSFHWDQEFWDDVVEAVSQALAAHLEVE